ncbi:MAG: DUF1326 domain-containing protein [Gemmatimonadales bacterium]|nr:DUF1326 domain-containing protein [Gemmatimonadales bacterium]
MTLATEARPRTAYRVRAQSVEACSCSHGCNCQFGGTPNEGICEFVIGYEVQEGRFGDVDLSGLRAVVAAKYPNAIHEGHGHVVLFVDEGARPEQVNAFTTILSGQAGGMPWEALAGTIERFEGPIAKPIDLAVDGQRAHVRIPGTVELETTPLRDPVTGQEKEVHITYPKGGFFWNDGNVVTTRTMRVDYESLRMEWPSKYASTAEVNWSNAG